MEIINALNWRYATKKMNGQAVSEEKVNIILEAARLAPTSAGLQPFSVLVIRNPELKKQILPIANNQQQVVDGSHLLVFAAWDHIDEKRVNDFIAHTTTERGLPADAMDVMKNRLISGFTTRTPEENFQYAARQAYIGFGMALAAAAIEKVDATPMEGFDAKALDELLGLKAKGLRSVSLMPLGYRDEANDWLAKLKKVRQPKNSFFVEFN